MADIPSAHDLIRYATLAPNGHNTQPWRFRIGERQIDIMPDFSRRTLVVDPDNHHLFVSLGAAAETLSLASAACGMPATIAFDPRNQGSVAVHFETARPAPSPLFDAITRRQSTRTEYDGRAVPVRYLDALVKAATVPGVDFVLLTDRHRIDRLRDLVLAGNTLQRTDPAFVCELKSWLRFNPRAATRAGDGLYSVASGNPALPDWLGPHAFDWISTARSENQAYAAQLRSSAGVAVFAGAGETAAHWFAVGRACQRFALQATALGLKHAFINQPVEVPSLRPDLAALIGTPGRRPDIVMRFGYGPTLPWSLRRSVDAVIVP
ncbi:MULTISPECIES: Acg family FMN-binding oxidoreductase [unclassified Sphingomonas]|uniref:Acg family FMN-binding oxidoreductase n=1 Tax=unclassified Sphingomonas TaxID=196159 RepID=UPI001E4D6E56|nr:MULTISPECIES: nitroreductase family protein [unclassified Sphingomonas]